MKYFCMKCVDYIFVECMYMEAQNSEFCEHPLCKLQRSFQGVPLNMNIFQSILKQNHQSEGNAIGTRSCHVISFAFLKTYRSSSN